MENREIRYQFGSLIRIIPETFGDPGNRTFRLVLRNDDHEGIVWTEKEQLYELGKYLQEACDDESINLNSTETVPSQLGNDYNGMDFKCRQMSVSFQKDKGLFYIECREEGETIDDMSSTGFFISGSQAESLSKAAISICESGRPICGLCHNPIDPDGHFCPKSNGHSKL
jgi:uncharacterized repeat protein (TIGR03847 family)